MAATVLGESLTFGAPTISGLVVQSANFDEAVNIEEVADEDGDFISAALHGRTATGSIEAVDDGSTQAIGATLAVTGAPSGTFYIIGRGTAFGNTAFQRTSLQLKMWGGI